MRPKPARLRLTLLALLFVSVVVAVASYTHQLIIPLFLGLLTWGKAWFKTLTPQLGFLLLKNGFFLQLRRLVMQASTHVFVKSHRPWRRWITAARIAAGAVARRWVGCYMTYPLWLRSLLALSILLMTAGSSFAIFALLIIPQPVLNWLRNQVMSILNKLGATQFFAALWRFAIPQKLRHQWHMHVKWTLGRRQVVAAKHLHSSIKRSE